MQRFLTALQTSVQLLHSRDESDDDSPGSVATVSADEQQSDNRIMSPHAETSSYSLPLCPVAVQWQVVQEIAEIADREDEGAGNASEDLHEQAHLSCDDNIRLAARDADSGPPSPGSPMPTCLTQELLQALTQTRRLSASPAARAPEASFWRVLDARTSTSIESVSQNQRSARFLPSPPASIPPPPLSLPSRSERSTHPPRQAYDTAARTDLASERESLRESRAPCGAASRRAHHFLSFESRCPFSLALCRQLCGCLLSLRVLIFILVLAGSQGRIAPRHHLQLPASPRL